jgi:hypothetical protein
MFLKVPEVFRPLYAMLCAGEYVGENESSRAQKAFVESSGLRHDVQEQASSDPPTFSWTSRTLHRKSKHI